MMPSRPQSVNTAGVGGGCHDAKPATECKRTQQVLNKKGGGVPWCQAIVCETPFERLGRRMSPNRRVGWGDTRGGTEGQGSHAHLAPPHPTCLITPPAPSPVVGLRAPMWLAPCPSGGTLRVRGTAAAAAPRGR